jgi:predicted DNA-binding ribbon-helix-helix protein
VIYEELAFTQDLLQNSHMQIKRSVSIAQHRTSISLEEPFWRHVKRLANLQNLSLNEYITAIDKGRGQNNLSSALRLQVLKDLEQRLSHH